VLSGISFAKARLESVPTSVLSLRAALALANPKTKPDPQPSEEYDRAENKLVEKLEALSPDTAEAAATETVERLREAVARIKTRPAIAAAQSRAPAAQAN
jgi:hypothetical protein